MHRSVVFTVQSMDQVVKRTCGVQDEEEEVLQRCVWEPRQVEALRGIKIEQVIISFSAFDHSSSAAHWTVQDSYVSLLRYTNFTETISHHSIVSFPH